MGGTSYIGGSGGYDDVDEEINVREANFLVSKANIHVSKVKNHVSEVKALHRS